MNWLQQRPWLAAVLLIVLYLIVSTMDYHDQVRAEQIALPPCDDCTRSQRVVYGPGNENRLAWPREGAGPYPHID